MDEQKEKLATQLNGFQRRLQRDDDDKKSRDQPSEANKKWMKNKSHSLGRLNGQLMNSYIEAGKTNSILLKRIRTN